MPFEDFREGDIVITGKGGHAVMWVGGAQPVVHNVDRGTFIGVIRQSTNYLDEYCRGQPVYRHPEPALGALAATYAIQWATVPGAQCEVPQDRRVVLKSPYSHKRMDEALMVSERPVPFTMDSLFRALKATARLRDGTGLSPNHGVSCSQFVTYCYQAAALQRHFGNALPVDVVRETRAERRRATPFDLAAWGREDMTARQHELARLHRNQAFAVETKLFRSLTVTEDREFLSAALAGQLQEAVDALPRGMRVDAKLTNAERLQTDLEAADSEFVRLGVVEHDGAANALRVLRT